METKPQFLIQLESGGIFAFHITSERMGVIGAEGFWGLEERPLTRMLEKDILAWQRIYERACSEGLFYAPDIELDWEMLHQNGLYLARRIKDQLGDEVHIFYERPTEDPDSAWGIRYEILLDGKMIESTPSKNTNFSDEINYLGRSLYSRWYQGDEIFQGLVHEQVRLGSNPFIVVVNVDNWDSDRVNRRIFLTESFSTQNLANTFAKDLSKSLLEHQLAQEESPGKPWVLPPEFSKYSLGNPKRGATLTSVLTEEFETITGEEHVLKHVTTRVIQCDGNAIVGKPLFDFINEDVDLGRYFSQVGKFLNGQAERPTPLINY